MQEYMAVSAVFFLIVIIAYFLYVTDFKRWRMARCQRKLKKIVGETLGREITNESLSQDIKEAFEKRVEWGELLLNPNYTPNNPQSFEGPFELIDNLFTQIGRSNALSANTRVMEDMKKYAEICEVKVF